MVGRILMFMWSFGALILKHVWNIPVEIQETRLGGREIYLASRLQYTILYYTILYYTILYYTILYYTILYYAMLYYTMLHDTIPYYIR